MSQVKNPTDQIRAMNVMKVLKSQLSSKRMPTSYTFWDSICLYVHKHGRYLSDEDFMNLPELKVNQLHAAYKNAHKDYANKKKAGQHKTHDRKAKTKA